MFIFTLKQQRRCLPTDLELEALQALAGLNQPRIFLTQEQDPIADLASHQNLSAAPTRPAVQPRALFHPMLGLASSVAAPFEHAREYCCGLNDDRIKEWAKLD